MPIFMNASYITGNGIPYMNKDQHLNPVRLLKHLMAKLC